MKGERGRQCFRINEEQRGVLRDFHWSSSDSEIRGEEQWVRLRDGEMWEIEAPLVNLAAQRTSQVVQLFCK